MPGLNAPARVAPITNEVTTTIGVRREINPRRTRAGLPHSADKPIAPTKRSQRSFTPASRTRWSAGTCLECDRQPRHPSSPMRATPMSPIQSPAPWRGARKSSRACPRNGSRTGRVASAPNGVAGPRTGVKAVTAVAGLGRTAPRHGRLWGIVMAPRDRRPRGGRRRACEIRPMRPTALFGLRQLLGHLAEPRHLLSQRITAESTHQAEVVDHRSRAHQQPAEFCTQPDRVKRRLLTVN